MDRRKFVGSVACGLLAVPLAVEAQQGPRVWRIGYLGDGFAASRTPINLDPFRDALSELGYVEGRNLVIEARWSDGDNERLAALASDLVRRQVDVIVTHGLPASRAAKDATTSIPMAAAVQWGKRGARVNTISPGIIFTPLAKDELTGPRGDGYRRMIELSAAGRGGTPDEVRPLALS